MFVLCGLYLEVSSSLRLLGVKIDNKLTFEKNICNIASSIAQKSGLIGKCYKTLGNDDAVLKSFYAFILLCFEYCSPVWCSAFDWHLKLLDCALNNIQFFISDILNNLENIELHSDCLCFIKFYKMSIIPFIANFLNL